MRVLIPAAAVLSVMYGWCWADETEPVEPVAMRQSDAESPGEPEKAQEAIRDEAVPFSLEEMVERSPEADGREGYGVSGEKMAFVVPISGVIGPPTHFIVRRALKEATSQGVNVVVFDMDTPGGRLDSTLKIMDAISRFKGETITFINTEAISAGAFIATSTDTIYMESHAQIGAAEVVTSTGEDIPEAMKRKLQSYVNAKVRVYTKSHRYRSDVMRAMTDPEFELEIDGKMICPKGELLSLTADEAVATYGEPPQTLLADGIAESVAAILEARYGKDAVTIRRFEITWSEELAQFLQAISPVLLSLGMILLFIEFKTPSFGVLGGLGILCILLVFAANYVAGLAGYEAALLFMVGLLLIGIELFLMPGMIIPAFLGICCVLISMVWSMADFWPKGDEGFGVVWVWDEFFLASGKVTLSFFGAVIVIALLLRYLPGTWLWKNVVLETVSASPDPVVVGGGQAHHASKGLPPEGAEGVALTPMIPIGEVSVDGRRFEALAQTGSIDRGTRIRVVGYRQFSLLVVPKDE